MLHTITGTGTNGNSCIFRIVNALHNVHIHATAQIEQKSCCWAPRKTPCDSVRCRKNINFFLLLLLLLHLLLLLSSVAHPPCVVYLYMYCHSGSMFTLRKLFINVVIGEFSTFSSTSLCRLSSLENGSFCSPFASIDSTMILQWIVIK